MVITYYRSGEYQMEVGLLLKDISAISEKYDLIYQKTGGYFNIFEITNVSTDEVIICRLLHDLLNPNGSHKQGNIYLKLFVQSVLQLTIAEEEYTKAVVYREFLVDANRRIDLVIQTPSHFIPIEVKIFAVDQPNQCEDYSKRALNSKVYYLTRFGTAPSIVSLGKLVLNNNSYDKITNISFAHDILQWLTNCLEHKETIKIAPIREVLLQFISVIRNFTNQLEDDKEMEIKKIITASAVSMKSAVQIEQSLKACKIDLMNKVFTELEKRIEKEKLQNEYDYEYNDGKKVKTYYEKQNSTYPGISYPYRQSVKPGVDIWFRIEIAGRMIAGFCVAVNGKASNQVLTEEEIKKFLPHISPDIENWWAFWDLLPVSDNAQSPDFKSTDCEDVYYNLYDEAYFEDFIKQSLESINKLFI